MMISGSISTRDCNPRATSFDALAQVQTASRAVILTNKKQPEAVIKIKGSHSAILLAGHTRGERSHLAFLRLGSIYNRIKHYYCPVF